jgi:acyl carrier protein
MDGQLESWNRDGAVHSDLHCKVVSILSEVLQVDIDPTIADISRNEVATWDSINHLRLVLELEEVFQIALSDGEVAELMTLRQVEALLAKRGILRSMELGT